MPRLPEIEKNIPDALLLSFFLSFPHCQLPILLDTLPLLFTVINIVEHVLGVGCTN